MTAAEIDEHPWRGDPGEIVTAETDADILVCRLRRLTPAWHAEAACVGMGTEVFFPSKGGSNAAALAHCSTCPARLPCVNEALDDPSLDHGIRGGATAAARRLMRIARAKSSKNVQPISAERADSTDPTPTEPHAPATPRTPGRTR
ncbi:hypothetical protein BH24DEI2_BH24DEI2_19680 [soil metagenome]